MYIDGGDVKLQIKPKISTMHPPPPNPHLKKKKYCHTTFIHYNKFDFFQGSKPLKKVFKDLKKNYFKCPIDSNNLRNIYRRKGNFDNLHGPENKCSNLILRVKRPLNNLLTRIKIFIFITLDK